MMMTMIVPVVLAASLLAQVPNPAPAINAAKDAKTKTEAAQQKNAEALPGSQVPGSQVPGSQVPGSQAPAAQQPPATPQGSKDVPPPPGAGYTYEPAGRRDPFVSLAGRGGDMPTPGAARPPGVPGLLISEVTVKGVLKSPKGGLIALVQATDTRTYILRQGDKVFDGSVKVITQDTVVFSQDVNDPLSLVKQREVRKSIRQEAR
jgi:Tfp pilus assembly protein PilP